jgi:hypothetical protein
MSYIHKINNKKLVQICTFFLRKCLRQGLLGKFSKGANINMALYWDSPSFFKSLQEIPNTRRQVSLSVLSI